MHENCEEWHHHVSYLRIHKNCQEKYEIIHNNVINNNNNNDTNLYSAHTILGILSCAARAPVILDFKEKSLQVQTNKCDFNLDLKQTKFNKFF